MCWKVVMTSQVSWWVWSFNIENGRLIRGLFDEGKQNKDDGIGYDWYSNGVHRYSGCISSCQSFFIFFLDNYIYCQTCIDILGCISSFFFFFGFYLLCNDLVVWLYISVHVQSSCYLICSSLMIELSISSIGMTHGNGCISLFYFYYFLINAKRKAYLCTVVAE